MNISLLDLAYVAGFLDGDGSIIAQLVSRKDYKWGFQIRVTIQFTQLTKRRMFLEDMQTLFGVGYIRDRVGANALTSDYVVTNVKHVYSMLKLLQPFLKMKKQQATLVIQLIEQMPLAKDSHTKFIELTKLVDDIAMLNDSKNRTITSATVIKHLEKL